jgi:ferredoxin-NADP reductase/MOSC domain-containing protein YiiM
VAKLLAVNVGLPKEISWKGDTVRTGVWKTPVTGRRTVRRLNIDGDGQGDLAGHGGEQRAVLVYQIDSYRYWQAYLKRDDFTFGQFGENFTVDGLPDDEVCIGDRYQIGSALFEVTQPRVTCYRVGLRMGEPEMPALLISHHRPGFYLRVIREGDVGAGDEIIKVAGDPAGITVTEIDALLYLPGHTRDKAAAAAAIPALSPGWKDSLRALLEHPESAAGGNPGLTEAGGPPPAWPGFRPLRVAQIDVESADVKSFHLAPVDAEPLAQPVPGQFVAVRLRPQPDSGPVLIRSYSLSGPPEGSTYRISVKQERNGAASTYLHTVITEGAVLEVSAPRGTFLLEDASRPIVLLSGGVGATPVLAMLYALVRQGTRRQVWWVHAAHDGAHHAFAAEVNGLVTQLADGHSYISYSQPRPTDRAGLDYTMAGRLSGDVLGRAGLPKDADVYFCGPPSFMADLSAAVIASGIDERQVHQEVFGALSPITPGVVRHPPRPPKPGSGPAGPAISFARSGLTVNWDATYGSLLELAEASNVPTRWSCRTGVCHTCETALLAGSVSYSPEPLDPPGDGNALICCSQPVGEVVLDL